MWIPFLLTVAWISLMSASVMTLFLIGNGQHVYSVSERSRRRHREMGIEMKKIAVGDFTRNLA